MMAENGADIHADRGVSARGSRHEVMLGNRVGIDPASPLPAFETPSAKAFAARDPRQPERRLVALICDPRIPTRTSVLATLKGTHVPGLLPLEAWGVVDWPSLGGRTMAIVYAQPQGGSLAEALRRPEWRSATHKLTNVILRPLVEALDGLHHLGITHRAIRPGNVFFSDSQHKSIVLGDCATTPPAFDQPLAFEPIERAMALPAGRGTGSSKDDLYALGATLAFLISGQDLAALPQDEALILAKLERGSYAVLCEGERNPITLIEPLRGLLNDDPKERWGFKHLKTWLEGRRPAVGRRRPRETPNIPFRLAERDLYELRSLAMEITVHGEEAAKHIREGSLQAWLSRSMNRTDLARAIDAAKAVAQSNQGSLRGSDEALVARVAMMLDPLAPVRYRGFSFMVDGLGPAMAVEWLHHGQTQAAGETIALGLATERLPPGSDSADPDVSVLGKTFAYLASCLQQKAHGFGMERWLYDSNPSLPCQSPLIVADYVLELRGLLPALERAAEKRHGDVGPVDRHVAAFIASRSGPEIERLVRTISDRDPAASMLAGLKLIATLQSRFNVAKLPALSTWFGDRMGPVIKTYKNLETRREIEAGIPAVAGRGKLLELLDWVGNAERRRKDAEGFRIATTVFATADSEIHKLEVNKDTMLRAAYANGHQVAAFVALIVSMGIVGATVVGHLI